MTGSSRQSASNWTLKSASPAAAVVVADFFDFVVVDLGLMMMMKLMVQSKDGGMNHHWTR